MGKMQPKKEKSIEKQGNLEISNVKLMKCASCTQLLCQKCCGNKCPMCQFESKNPKAPTFVVQSELMDILSGFKTHPCVNIKNGCFEEIPANLNNLRDHEESCGFQMVPCPKLNCKETFCFNKFDHHLKNFHIYYIIIPLVNDITMQTGHTTDSEWKFEGSFVPSWMK